jgi:hypothetical protein
MVVWSSFHTTGAVMSRLRTIALLAAGAAAFIGASPVAASAATTAWPPLPPKCQHVVPVGSVFVKRVQPPDGLAYEIWRLPSGQLITVYC